jgi:hypothetical protein
MTQIERNVTDVEEGFLRGTRYLILDRDTKYYAINSGGDLAGRFCFERASLAVAFLAED